VPKIQEFFPPEVPAFSEDATSTFCARKNGFRLNDLRRTE